MKKLEKLVFHSAILPVLERAAGKERDDNENLQLFVDWFESAKCAVIFDVRQIDLAFIDDTGDAAFHEAESLGARIRLPFENCYFEFERGYGLLCDEEECDDGPTVKFSCHDIPPNGFYEGSFECSMEPLPHSEYIDDLADGMDAAWGHFNPDPIGDEEKRFFHRCSDARRDTVASGLFLERAAKRLLGILALMNDHLIATELRDDPAPRLNKARAKKDRLPISAETRVLTINTAAVRRAASGGRLLQHETPRLHWRRGHTRLLHRGSEFESKTWVRRCLVGDPARGSVHKDYRVVWNQPMLQ